MRPTHDDHPLTDSGEWRAILGHLSEALLLLDQDLVVTYANGTAERLLGRDRSEILGRPLFDVLPEVRGSELESRCRQVIAERRPAELETRVGCPPGADRCHVRVLPLRPGIAALFTVVSERSAAAQALGASRIEESRRTDDLNALFSCTSEVLRSRDFPQVARTLYDACKSLLGATTGYVVAEGVDLEAGDALSLEVPPGSCAVNPESRMSRCGLRALAATTGEVVIENDFPRSQWAAGLPSDHAPVHNVLLAPMALHGRVVGLLGFANKPGGFSPADARLAGGVGTIAALALHHYRTIAALETSEARFRSLFDAAAEAIVSADASGRILLWNRAAERMFGYSAAEARGQPVTLLMPEPMRPRHDTAMRRWRDAGGGSPIAGTTFVATARRRDGSEFTAELAPAMWMHGGRPQVAVMLRDVSSRQALERELDGYRQHLEEQVAERTAALDAANAQLREEAAARERTVAALEAAKEQYRIVADNTYDWEYWLGPDGRLRYCSPSCLRITGRGPAEFLADPALLREIVHPEDQAEVARHHEWSLQSDVSEAHSLEFRVVRPDGSECWIEHACQPVFAADGTFLGRRSSNRDATARKRIEALVEAERRALNLVARHAPLEATLDVLVRRVEAAHPGAVCSLLLLDQDGERLRHAAAPSLPAEYSRAIDGVRIGPQVGSCGTAAFRNETVVVGDVLTDPLWADYRELASSHGLRACWSVPIRSGHGSVLGTFATYYRSRRRPTAPEIAAVEGFTHVAAIAIEHHRAHARLRDSEARFRSILEHAPIGINLAGIDRRILLANPAFCQLLGYEEAELRRMTINDFSFPDDQERPVEDAQRLVAGEQLVLRKPKHYRRRDGGEAWANLTVCVIPDEAGRPSYFLGLNEDITERRQRELEVARLAAALEQTAEAVIITSETGTIDYVNGAFAQLTGYSRGEVVGRHQRFLRGGDRDDAFFAHAMATLRQGQPWRGVHETRRKDGTCFLTAASVTPISHPGDQGVYFVGVARDITAALTARREAEEKERLAAIGRIAGGIAHEIKNPLFALSSGVQLLLEELQLTADQRETMEIMLTEVTRMDRLVRQLRDFSSDRPPVRSSCVVGELVRTVAASVRGAARAREVSLDVDVPADLPPLRADRDQVVQVLLNVVQNAIEASPHGGTVEIAAALQADGAGGPCLELRVADRGPGLPGDKLAEVFAPFYTTKRGNSGMGLAISRKIMASHGGRIIAGNRDGGGAVFAITFGRGADVAVDAASEAP